MKSTLLAATAFAASATLAAETNDTASATAELPSVTVEASRLDRTAHEIPAHVQVIGRDEIAASGARDIADLLSEKSPFVQIHSLGGSNPALRQISMGGYGENGFGRVTILVDGERLNNPDMSAPNLAQIPLGAIQQIEVLTGSQSVLQGDGASAGVINVVTLPEDGDYAPHGKIELHGGSWDTIGGSLSLRGGVESERLRYWGHGGWDHSEGYRHKSEHNLYNVNGGLRKSWENGSYIRASVFHSDADYGLAGPLSRDGWQHSPTHSEQPKDDFYRRISYGLNMTAYGVIDEENAVKLTSTASRRTMKSRTTSYGYPWNVQYDMYSTEITPQWINTTSLFGLDNTVTAGATYRYDRNHARSGNGNWAKYAILRQSAGFFAQDTLRLTESLALQLGGRYERAWLDGSKYIYGRDTRNCNLHAYDAALLFTPVEDLKTYVRFSRHFRTPFIDENSGHILSPETGFTLDVGGDYNFLDDFSVGGNVYYSRLKHEIFYNPLLGWGTNVNSPDATERGGLNLRAAWEKEKLAGLALAYSYVDAEFDGGQFDGNRVPGVAESTVSLTCRVWLWNDSFVFGGYRYQNYMYSISDFNNTNDKSARVPAFGIFHLGVQYAPSYAALKGWKVGLTIDNLLDKNYCDYVTYGTSYYPGAGRSYMFTVSYEF